MKELEIIKKILEKTHKDTKKNIIKDIGDDCAIVNPENLGFLAITTDTLVENIHFNLKFIKPYELGKKAVSVNVSDMAAVGGKPLWATLNLAFTPSQNENFWNEFISGVFDTLKHYDVSLIGGDTVSSPILTINITLIGSIFENKWLKRAGARVGDRIYVSGFLGDSACGLDILNGDILNNIEIDENSIKYLIERHKDPLPRLYLGQLLATEELANSAIDLSDGLATDLAHLCKESGVCAIINENLIPLSDEIKLYSKYRDKIATDYALKGGEDYELLWTVDSEKEEEMIKKVTNLLGYKPFYIGEITEGEGVYLRKIDTRILDITFQGYEHGKNSENR